MLDIEKTILSAKIRERIDRLHSDKIQINQEKIRHLGHLDIEDRKSTRLNSSHTS